MVTLIKARDIPDSWFQCLEAVLKHGRKYKVEHGSYAGSKRKELDYVVIEIKYPATRPLIPDIPPHLNIPPPVTEDYLYQYMSYLVEDKKADREEYTYGYYISKQLDTVIQMYKKHGFETNQGYITVGEPNCVFMKNPPCLRGIDTRIRDGKLHFFVYFRSWDLWNGYPANLGALQLLKEYMASELGVEDGEIIASSKGLHLYDYAWEYAERRIGYKN